MKIYIKYIIAAERQRGNTLIVTFQFLMRSVSFAPDPPDLSNRSMYCRNLNFCLWLVGDVRFSGEQDFSFFNEYGGGGGGARKQDITNFYMYSGGDVSKTKPGQKVQVNTKVSINLFVSTNTHQGGESFSIESRGKQCTFMSLSGNLAAECELLKEWSQSTINNVLLKGDYMYIKALIMGYLA